MGKIQQMNEMLGGYEAINDSVDAQLEHNGQLIYIPPEAPLAEIDEADLDTISEYNSTFVMRQIFAEERDNMRSRINESINELKLDNEGEIRLSDDFTYNVSEEDLDELMEAHLEDIFNGEEEIDESDEEAI